MAIDQSTFIDDFIAFAQASMDWCVAESDKETMNVSNTIEILVAEFERRALVSDQTLTEIREFKEKLATLRKNPSDLMSNMLVELKKLSDVQRDMNDLINPVIEGLQFQDRLRQNLENLAKMLNVWLGQRRDAGVQDDVVSFGKKLLDCTTAPDEREVIRQAIAGLPEENHVEQSLMF